MPISINSEIITSMPKILYIMCGIPGSGKTTKAKSIQKDLKKDGFKSKIISRDEIRIPKIDLMMYNNIVNDPELRQNYYFSKEKEVRKEFIAEIVKGLEHNHVVFADATNISYSQRMTLLDLLEEKGVFWRYPDINLIYGLMETSFKESVRRNNERTGIRCVPYDVVHQHEYQFKEPIRDYEVDYAKQLAANVFIQTFWEDGKSTVKQYQE